MFREIYSFPNVKLEENCEPRGAYDDGSIFSRQMEAIELSLNYFATSREKITNTLLFPEFFSVLKYDLMNTHMSIFCNNQKTLGVVDIILKFWAKCMKSASLN